MVHTNNLVLNINLMVRIIKLFNVCFSYESTCL